MTSESGSTKGEEDISYKNVKYFCIALFSSLVVTGFVTSNEADTEHKMSDEPYRTPIIKVEVDMSPFETMPVPNLEIIGDCEPTYTLYDRLTPEEINLIEVTIQHEVGNFSKQYKTYVAELIYNRLISDRFPSTIREVLFQKGQFQGIEKWYYSGIEPDNETKEVVKEVFSSETPSHNCIGYYNPALSEYESIVWFEYSGDVQFVFEYTEESWGIEYTTRFFSL